MAESSQQRPDNVPLDKTGEWVDVRKSQDNTEKSQVMQQAKDILAAVTQQQNQRG